MSGDKYLLDTNIILYILSGDETIARHLHQKILFASIISEIELLGYKELSSKQEKSIKEFLSDFRIISIDEAIKNEAIDLGKKYSLKLPDCIVAATAITLNLTLITSDKQFRQVNNLLLELYER
jgi:predicted nucleic acid-binding protein